MRKSQNQKRQGNLNSRRRYLITTVKVRFVFLKLVFGSGQQDICLNNWQWVFKLTFTILDLGNSGFRHLLMLHTCLHLDQVETGLKCEKEISTSGKDWLLTITRCCTDYYFLRKSEVKVTIDTDELCEGFGFFLILHFYSFKLQIWKSLNLLGKNNWL